MISPFAASPSSSIETKRPSSVAPRMNAITLGISWLRRVNNKFTLNRRPQLSILGGHVMVQVGAGESIPYIKQGTVRILCHLGEKRIKDFPDVPTLRELGYDFFNENVFMFAAPRGTPSQIINRLDDVFHKAMSDPEFYSLTAKIELEPLYRNSTDLKNYLEDAYVRIGRIIRELKIPREVGDKK